MCEVLLFGCVSAIKMENTNFCGKCNSPFELIHNNPKSNFIRCGSICGRVFHLNCCGVEDNILKLLLNSSNLLWQCDYCAASFDSSAVSRLNSFSLQLRDLQCKFDEFKVNLFKNMEIPTSKTMKKRKAKKPLIRIASPTLSANDQFVDALDEVPNANQANINTYVATAESKDVRVEHTSKNINNTKTKKKGTIGTGEPCDDFSVVHSIKYIHLSKFNTNTQPDSIIKFIANKLNVNAESLTCYKLVKKDSDVSKLRYVNFKLGVPAPLFNKAFDSGLWPLSIKISRFLQKPKNFNELTAASPPLQQQQVAAVQPPQQALNLQQEKIPTRTLRKTTKQLQQQQ